MSGVAGLYNVPSTEAELLQWSFIHAAHHVDINRAIFEQIGPLLVSYVLDPIDPLNSSQWLAQHQTMHQNQDAFLGISGYDLSEVDFRDQNLLAGWIFENAEEHRLAANILGIG